MCAISWILLIDHSTITEIIFKQISMQHQDPEAFQQKTIKLLLQGDCPCHPRCFSHLHICIIIRSLFSFSFLLKSVSRFIFMCCAFSRSYSLMYSLHSHKNVAGSWWSSGIINNTLIFKSHIRNWMWPVYHQRYGRQVMSWSLIFLKSQFIEDLPNELSLCSSLQVSCWASQILSCSISITALNLISYLLFPFL
jgi:hypothetical protein